MNTNSNLHIGIVIGGRSIQSIGHTDFTITLLKELIKHLTVDHVNISAFDDHLKPHRIAAESLCSKPLAKRVGKEYDKGLFFRHDPNIKLIQKDEPDQNQPMLFHLKAEDISDQEYRSCIYEKYKLADRLSIIDHTGTRWFVINFYRDRSTGCFSTEEVQIIQSMALLIAALVVKHFTMLPPLVWQAETRPPKEMLEELVSSLGCALSKREIEVCARALLGMTNTGIGLELGIQVSTVATVRKRAYTKLNISSLNELFSLCLAKSTSEPDL